MHRSRDAVGGVRQSVTNEKARDTAGYSHSDDHQAVEEATHDSDGDNAETRREPRGREGSQRKESPRNCGGGTEDGSGTIRTSDQVRQPQGRECFKSNHRNSPEDFHGEESLQRA